MVVEERFADVVELRPGRFIFCKHWRLGSSSGSDANAASTNNNNNNNNNRYNTGTTTTTGTIRNKETRRITLICVHGTAANHSQFIPFLTSLEARLLPEAKDSPTVIDCWMYDALGCGESQRLDENKDAYCDYEQVQDLKALLQDHVQPTVNDNSQQTFIMGHSYGPNWIYKLILSLSPKEQIDINMSGLILVCSSLGNPKYQLQKGGPPLFRLPLWILNCMQPYLTNVFLNIGFASATHTKHPQMIQDAKHANNRNDMNIVRRYYQSHDWCFDLSDIQIGYYGTTGEPSSSRRPPLVLHGIEDQVIPIQCGQDLANKWKTEIITVPDASHMILLEQPDTLATHVLGYMFTTS